MVSTLALGILRLYPHGDASIMIETQDAQHSCRPAPEMRAMVQFAVKTWKMVRKGSKAWTWQVSERSNPWMVGLMSAGSCCPPHSFCVWMYPWFWDALRVCATKVWRGTFSIPSLNSRRRQHETSEVAFSKTVGLPIGTHMLGQRKREAANVCLGTQRARFLQAGP